MALETCPLTGHLGVLVKDQRVDYLVVGAGAMGMAFTDTLMTESDATVAIVDRQHQPGGHRNLAYPIVTIFCP